MALNLKRRHPMIGMGHPASGVPEHPASHDWDGTSRIRMQSFFLDLVEARTTAGTGRPCGNARSAVAIVNIATTTRTTRTTSGHVSVPWASEAMAIKYHSCRRKRGRAIELATAAAASHPTPLKRRRRARPSCFFSDKQGACAPTLETRCLAAANFRPQSRPCDPHMTRWRAHCTSRRRAPCARACSVGEWVR